jgi:hypothetical protein
MQRAAELIDLTQYISNAPIQRSVLRVLQTFRDQTTKKLGSLPRQVIHNDANPSNILLPQNRVTGTQFKNRVPVTLIDFGDMMRAARVIEVATAAAYLRATDDPLQFIAPFVSAYHGENPLTPGEFDVLYDLIRTRLAMTITILYWRLSARDENDSYRKQSLASEQNAFDFLAALDELGRSHFNAVMTRETESR